MGACVVANAPFYYGLFKELLQGHYHRPSCTSISHRSQARDGSFVLSSKTAIKEYSLGPLEYEQDSHDGSDQVAVVYATTLEVSLR